MHRDGDAADNTGEGEGAPPPPSSVVAEDKSTENGTSSSAGKDKKPQNWKCDYCPFIFPDYHTAVAHEKKCKAEQEAASTKEANGQAPTGGDTMKGDVSNPSKESDPKGAKEKPAAGKTLWRCEVCMVFTSFDYDVALSHENECKMKKENVPKKPAAGRTRWRCEACMIFTSFDYDVALSHENECKMKKENVPKTIVVRKKGVEVGPLKSGGTKEGKKKLDAAKNGRNAEKATAASTQPVPAVKTSPGKKRKSYWRCDVCMEAVFPTYDEAVEHERGCGSNKRAKINDDNAAVAKGGNDKEGNDVASGEIGVQAVPPAAGASNTIKESNAPTQPKAQKKESLPFKPTLASVQSRPGALSPTLMDYFKTSDEDERQVCKETMTPVADVSVKEVCEGVKLDGKIENLGKAFDDAKEEGRIDEEDTTTDAERRFSIRSTFFLLLKVTLLVIAPTLLVKFGPPHIWERVLTAMFVPSVAFFAMSLVVLLILAYSSFALALVVTHEGPHHHQSMGVLGELVTTVQDTLHNPDINAAKTTDEKEKLPTLREYLNHPDGFHMAFAPAFFGFFAYFGSLAALEEETGGLVVPKVGDKKEGATTSGLKSVAGASAGAMAAVMLASGIQPRVAADYVSTLTWKMVADPPGLGGFVKGKKFEEFMRKFIMDTACIRVGAVSATNDSDNKTPINLEDSLVPVAVSGFDLLRMRETLLTRGCAAKAARSSAGFPGLFQPVAWREGPNNKHKWLPECLLIDGGVRDGLGLNGLGAFLSTEKKRVINIVVGDFGFSGPSSIKDLPEGINAESLVSIAIVNTPICGPWAMQNGPRAVDSARKAMKAALDSPMERGACDNHYVLRVDASKWLE
ncbi:predicted protein [Thalassiosira pseudonana CCMP1335]|uniref:PNPLA domain-containing protein n=1 Tax=Thalassiosira pseudonana TaxID=35128 RepID=B8CE60_THAPS|nr:predicted protein [Thalassiosira pseudonana CCMP1335]EED88216.1 predicted protein [Thalassiosira pseudonana CCMP1335]|eukprot:scaffold845_cov199-Alexandrium_tamarense.AAC.27